MSYANSEPLSLWFWGATLIVFYLIVRYGGGKKKK